jgi:hypothetical protein
MARPSPRQLRRRLRRLDDRDLARFVAALWAAGGWSTAVREGRVVALRHDRATERLDLAVVAGPVGVAGTLARTPDDADAVVTPVGERTARLLAARTDRPVVDAADLHERLTYAVPGEAREHLLAEHLPEQARVERRQVLSSLALGGGVLGGGALRTTGGERTTASSVWYDLGGPTPGAPGLGDADDEDAPPDGTGGPTTPTGEGAATPTGERTIAPLETNGAGCDGGPREALREQLVTFRREVAVHSDTGVEGEKPVGYDLGIATESFLAAVEGVSYEPFRQVESLSVGEPREDADDAVVPLRLVTDDGRTVRYEFALRQNPAGCWRTTDAERLDGD